MRGGLWLVDGFLDALVKNWEQHDDERRRELLDLAQRNVQRVKAAILELDEWRSAL